MSSGQGSPRLAGTALWYGTVKVPRRAVFSYLLLLNVAQADWDSTMSTLEFALPFRTDPLNKHPFLESDMTNEAAYGKR